MASCIVSMIRLVANTLLPPWRPRKSIGAQRSDQSAHGLIVHLASVLEQQVTQRPEAQGKLPATSERPPNSLSHRLVEGLFMIHGAMMVVTSSLRIGR